jgi:hypothetical protein
MGPLTVRDNRVQARKNARFFLSKLSVQKGRGRRIIRVLHNFPVTRQRRAVS